MQYDTIVVGAGIEGSAAAYDLAKRGRKTLLLEQVLVDCCSGSTAFDVQKDARHTGRWKGRSVDRSLRRRGIKGVDKGGALYPGLLVDDVAMHAAMLQVEISRLGPNLQNILRQSYDFLTIMPMLRSTYDGRLIYKGSKAMLKYDSLAKL